MRNLRGQFSHNLSSVSHVVQGNTGAVPAEIIHEPISRSDTA